MYNLIAGISLFFEDDAADIIGMILSYKRGDTILSSDISETLGIASVSIKDFMEDLVSYGLSRLNQCVVN